MNVIYTNEVQQSLWESNSKVTSDSHHLSKMFPVIITVAYLSKISVSGQYLNANFDNLSKGIIYNKSTNSHFHENITYTTNKMEFPSNEVTNFSMTSLADKVEVINLNNDQLEFGKVLQKLEDLQKSVDEIKVDVKNGPTKDYISAEIHKAKTSGIKWMFSTNVTLATLTVAIIGLVISIILKK